MQVTLKERSPKRSASWAVKNQQSKKRNADSDTNTSNGGHRGSNHEKFKQGANRKDHWASAKQHILETNNEDTQREETEIERRRRRRRKEGDSSSTGDAPGNSKVDASRITAEEAKTRRVPRKLPLQSTVEQAQSWSDAERRNSGTTQIKSKTKRTPVNNDAQNNCEMNEARSINRVTRNGLRNWEAECTSTSNGIEETTDANVVRNATVWPGQWRPPPDDVQPCSSKTIDPYSFA